MTLSHPGFQDYLDKLESLDGSMYDAPAALFRQILLIKEVMTEKKLSFFNIVMQLHCERMLLRIEIARHTLFFFKQQF